VAIRLAPNQTLNSYEMLQATETEVLRRPKVAHH
jgi:hypothetical protein